MKANFLTNLKVIVLENETPSIHLRNYALMVNLMIESAFTDTPLEYVTYYLKVARSTHNVFGFVLRSFWSLSGYSKDDDIYADSFAKKSDGKTYYNSGYYNRQKRPH